MLRTEIARQVCTALDWREGRGDLKAMSCRVALLRLHREELIVLPAPRNGNGSGKPLCKQRVELPAPSPLSCSVNELEELSLQLVQSKADSAPCTLHLAP